MPMPSLALLDDERSTAFDGFVGILARDLRLKAIGMEWHSWKGGSDDGVEPADADLPWCQLTPIADPSSWGPQQTLDSPMQVEFDLAVPGTNVRDGMKVWRAIERAIYGTPGDLPGQAAALAALYAVGISSVDIVMPAFGIDVQSTAVQSRQRFKGRVRLHVYVPCPGF